MPELLPLRFLLLWLLHSGVTLAWATKSTLASVKAWSRNDPVEHLGLTVQHGCPVCLPAALRPTSCELSQAVSGLRGNMEAHEAILLSVVLPKLLWSAPLVPAVERKLDTSFLRACRGRCTWWCKGRVWADHVTLHPRFAGAVRCLTSVAACTRIACLPHTACLCEASRLGFVPLR